MSMTLREILRRSRDLRPSIIIALVAGFTAVAVIAAIAFSLTVLGATDTTQALLLDRTRRMVDTEVKRIRHELDPVAERLELLAELVGSGRIDGTSAIVMQDMLEAAFAPLRNVTAAGYSNRDAVVYRVLREGKTFSRNSVPLREVSRGIERYRELQAAPGIYWGDLLWADGPQQPMVNVRMPLRGPDRSFLGGLIATVSLGDLSRAVADPELGGEGGSFILAGRDHVLAHRRLIDPTGLSLDERHLLPSLAAVGDNVLAAIWQPQTRPRRIVEALGDVGHVVTVEGREWVFVYRTVTGYSPEPWIVGRYFPIEVATRDLERLQQGIFAGAAALLAALVLAAIMGIRMAGSIRDLGRVADALARLDFNAGPARRSRLKELHEAAEAMGRAQAALRWFGLYVPDRLVRRLMAEGEETLASRRRTVTVMFTDIVGFTPQAEDMDEVGTAELLNRHFAMLGAAIDAEHGMIDKYIGDSVMAVWGAIRRMPDHADAACRAAIEIARLIREDNAERGARGERPIRVRIGLHSGVVTVGNIGAPGRVNYTVVGDTVNVAQRMEQLGKQYMKDDEDVIVLATGETLAALQDRGAAGALPRSVGEQPVRGREAPVEVYRLD